MHWPGIEPRRMWGKGRQPANCVLTKSNIISSVYSSTMDGTYSSFQLHWVKQVSLSTPLYTKNWSRLMNVLYWLESVVFDRGWWNLIYRNSEGYTTHSFRDKQSWNVGGIYNCVLEFFFLLDRKLFKVMEGEIVGKMFCVFFFNFSMNPPLFVFPSDSLHQLVPGMTQQKVWRSATLSIWSCRAPPTGRPGKGGRLYGNQWFSLHSPSRWSV